MSRTFNSFLAAVTAILLLLFVGGCETKTEEAVENVAVENAVEVDVGLDTNAVADVNAVDNAAGNALEEAGNAVDAVGNGPNQVAPPPPPPPPPPEPGSDPAAAPPPLPPPALTPPPPNGSDPSAAPAPAPAPPPEPGSGSAAAPPPPATDSGSNDDAEEGLGSFKELSDMEVDNWYTVQFFVAPDEAGLGKEAGLDREGVNSELTAPAFVYVAPAMRVTLKDDPNFEIRPKSDAVVITGPDKSATWLWNVKPLTGGERTLYATVEVLQRNPDGSLKKNADGSYVASKPKTRSANVKVKVGTWKGFLIALRNAASLGDVLSTLFSAWQKTLIALAALITAAWGVVWAIRSRGRPQRDDQPR